MWPLWCRITFPHMFVQDNINLDRFWKMFLKLISIGTSFRWASYVASNVNYHRSIHFSILILITNIDGISDVLFVLPAEQVLSFITTFVSYWPVFSTQWMFSSKIYIHGLAPELISLKDYSSRRGIVLTTWSFKDLKITLISRTWKEQWLWIVSQIFTSFRTRVEKKEEKDYIFISEMPYNQHVCACFCHYFHGH